MNNMKILHHDGRVVAINKCGKWEPLNGVSRYEVSQAIRNGFVEDYVADAEPTSRDIVDLALNIATCIAILFTAIYFLNLE